VTFTVNNQANDSFAGQITGNLNLAKSNTGTLVISGPNSYAGVTMMNGGVLSVSADNNLGNDVGLSFNGGTLLFTGQMNTAQPITIGGNGGTLDIGANNYDDSNNNAYTTGISGTGVFNKYGSANLTIYNIRAGGLGVGTGTVTVASGRDETNKTSTINSLSITSGAALDLGDNDLIYNTTDSSQPQAIRALLKTGFNNGSWTGTGITSIAAAATASSSARTALGYATGTQLGLPSGGAYEGQPVTSGNSIVIRYTYSGDADLDGTVGSSDFDLLAANYGKTDATWNEGDFNYDGTVNALDFNALATNYGDSNAAALPAGSEFALGTLVPEPGTLGLLLVAAPLWIRRSRRHSR
jgi:autotransporter-associated beta strand protein